MINLTFEYRKRPRTFLGAGLILISFLAALSISSAANKSVEVWAVSRSTSSGSALAVDNLRKIKVYLPENLSTYLPVSEKIAGKYVSESLGAGELIPRSLLVATNHELNSRQLPLKIAKNDLPIDLQRDEIVDLYLVSGKEGESGAISQLIFANLRILAVDNKSRDLGGDVGVLFATDASHILPILSSASQGRVVVVRHAH